MTSLSCQKTCTAVTVCLVRKLARLWQNDLLRKLARLWKHCLVRNLASLWQHCLVKKIARLWQYVLSGNLHGCGKIVFSGNLHGCENIVFSGTLRLSGNIVFSGNLHGCDNIVLSENRVLIFEFDVKKMTSIYTSLIYMWLCLCCLAFGIKLEDKSNVDNISGWGSHSSVAEHFLHNRLRGKTVAGPQLRAVRSYPW